jgi:hypothetical protein
MLKVVVTLLVIAAAALLPVLAWASYDVTGSSPASTFHTGVRVPAECAGMTFDQVITLTGGDDTTVVPGSTRDLIFGLGGRDEIDGGNGPDCIVGGDGDDRLKGGNGGDVILGGPGNDKIEGGHGDDRLYGGDGDDEIEGEKGNDTIDGGPGRDECDGGSGSDTISGCEHSSHLPAPLDVRGSCDHSLPTVELSWGQIEGAVYYNIYRGRAQGGPYEGIGSSRVAAFQDQDVVEGLAYYYIVTAVDRFEVQTEDSNEAGVLTALSTPGPSPAPIVTPSPSAGATTTPASEAKPTTAATPEQEPMVSPEPSPSPKTGD